MIRSLSKKAPGLIPLKKGLPTEKYGGYNSPTASFFVLARFKIKEKREVMIVPVNLLNAKQFLADADYARQNIEETIHQIIGKEVEHLELRMNGRPLKINTVFSLDGTLVTLAGKNSGGSQILISPLCPLKIGAQWESYVKRMESYQQKLQKNTKIQLDERYDGISRQENQKLYELLTSKMGAWPFRNLPNNQHDTLTNGMETFCNLEIKDQVECLMNILILFGSGAGGANLSKIGISGTVGVKRLNSRISNWKKNYQNVYIIHMSASGLFENRSENLLELL